MAQVVVHGGRVAQVELLAALEHNCACVYDDGGVRTSICAGHWAFVSNQSFVDHMEWGRWLAARCIAEEWTESRLG